MDLILTLMAIVGKMNEARDSSDDSTERNLVATIIEAFEAYISHLTQVFADTIKDPEDFNAVMYQLMDMEKAAEIVEAIWIPGEEPPLQEGGFSAN